MVPCCIACFNWIKRLPEAAAHPSVGNSHPCADANAAGAASGGAGGGAGGASRKIIPLDNLIMFLNNPGGNCISQNINVQAPDCRSVFRLMCHLSSEVVVRIPMGQPAHSKTQVHKDCRLKNPYLMFFSPITERIVECFGKFYGSSEPVFAGQLSAAAATAAAAVQRHDANARASSMPSSDEGDGLVNDVNTAEAMHRIIYWWWESTGMPIIMPHKECAKNVRKALRADSIRRLPDSSVTSLSSSWSASDALEH